MSLSRGGSRRWAPLSLLSALTFGVACGGSSALSPDEERQEVKEQGHYCCTHDGQATPGSDCRVEGSATYLAEYSNVDGAGRGDACGWILDSR